MCPCVARVHVPPRRPPVKPCAWAVPAVDWAGFVPPGVLEGCCPRVVLVCVLLGLCWGSWLGFVQILCCTPAPAWAIPTQVPGLIGYFSRLSFYTSLIYEVPVSIYLSIYLSSLAVWRVCATAPSFVSGWRAFSPVSFCKSIYLSAAAYFAEGAARTPGFAAAARDASKRRAYRQVSSALSFVPMSVESFGRLGASALTLLGDLAYQAVQAGGPGLSRAAFISGRSGSLALPLAGATHPYVGRARTSRRVPLAGLRCAVSPGPRLRLFRPVPRPVCGFGVFGSASLCVS
jgi:hypothetical protein